MQNESFTDVLAVVSGKKKQNKVNIILESGTECQDATAGIPSVPEFIFDRGVTVIEDHTLAVCGGTKNTGNGMILHSQYSQY